MKKLKFMICLMLSLFLSISLYAQPSYSTAENPVWYYIQVQGEGVSEDLVFTLDDNGRVYGREKAETLDRSTINQQLWRIEKSGSQMYVFNKATNKQLDVVYDTQLRIRVVSTVTGEPSTKWRLAKSGDYYTLQIVTEPTEGVSGAKFAYQSTATARNFVIMFEMEAKKNDANALFRFLEYKEENTPVASEGANETWFFIKTAKDGVLERGVTAYSNPTDPEITFGLDSIVKTNENQYWKFVKKADSAVEKYHLINKATGKIIGTDVILNRLFYVQPAGQLDDSNGWQTILINGDQFELKGVADNGIIRYMNAASASEGSSDIYNPKKSLNTGFAWTFINVNDYELPITSINNPNDNNTDVRVYSENNRIIVKGSDDYIVRNISGVQLAKNSYLQTGIYFVTVNGKTVKVLVR
ncbi:MAG: hypothetical protein LBH12_06905 [Dysgonamonadaceae bacterium]|jgi:hypothetical protein|nr:hypothetical protein [Dysgonamonadaceae bacterium]